MKKMENDYSPSGSGNGAYEGGYGTSTGTPYNPGAMEYDSGDVPMVLGIGAVIFMFVIGIASYVYVAMSLKKMAEKLSIQDAWHAWVPILNIVLLLKIANRPLWWILLLFVPMVNIIITVIIWMDVAKAMGKPEWWGFLIVVPVVSLIVPGYLAFSQENIVSSQNAEPEGDANIPDGAVVADIKNADFTEGMAMENDAASQWKNKKEPTTEPTPVKKEEKVLTLEGLNESRAQKVQDQNGEVESPDAPSQDLSKE